MMGGSESIDYLAPSGSGENTLVTCERGDYAADLEIARGVPRAPTFPDPLGGARRGRDARDHDVRGARRLPRDRPRRDLQGDAGRRRRQVVLALVRGDDRLDEAKLAAVLGADVRPHRPTRSGRRSAPSRARSGPSASAAGRSRRGDPRRPVRRGREPHGFHLRGVEHGRDFEAEVADIRLPREGDTCPRCGGALRFRTAIEVGHIFKLGTYYPSRSTRRTSTSSRSSARS